MKICVCVRALECDQLTITSTTTTQMTMTSTTTAQTTIFVIVRDAHKYHGEEKTRTRMCDTKREEWNEQATTKVRRKKKTNENRKMNTREREKKSNKIGAVKSSSENVNDCVSCTTLYRANGRVQSEKRQRQEKERTKIISTAKLKRSIFNAVTDLRLVVLASRRTKALPNCINNAVKKRRRAKQMALFDAFHIVVLYSDLFASFCLLFSLHFCCVFSVRQSSKTFASWFVFFFRLLFSIRSFESRDSSTNLFWLPQFSYYLLISFVLSALLD